MFLELALDLWFLAAVDRVPAVRLLAGGRLLHLLHHGSLLHLRRPRSDRQALQRQLGEAGGRRQRHEEESQRHGFDRNFKEHQNVEEGRFGSK